MNRLIRRLSSGLASALFTLGLGASLASVAVSPALASGFPDKPVTMLVPFPPGGTSDFLARAMGAKLQAKWGQTVIVDNRPGATGTLGTAQIKRSTPDGYNILVSSLGPFVIAPHLLKSVQYDALKDLDLLTVAVQAPNVLVVPASSPLKSLKDVIEELKKRPGQVTFCSSGNGSSDHLTAELFWLQTGTSGLHVPYKGGGPAISDLLGAQIDASFQNINSVLSHIQAGKLRALAVTGDKRSAVLPDVATLSELGVKGADVYSWQGVAVPRGLPAALRTQLVKDMTSVLQDPAIQKQFKDLGFEIVASNPDQAQAFQKAEYARWKQLIETRKITAD
ncbi:tripartite tricarboxylate transporter substrate binding protein [Roseateles sp. SL47]|uniref:Bug family tripartite tricarboxylate transporter substrate binding protein n=1 Tax=Roseateles sp. SL47 TaxID=2995138 RepID=UPI00226F2FF4|nr:tripartite tricarboxylate transporter substrate binding protein [Roseateles sp. SL47]WAC75056.1 tripartite tricarboxylate transporter substrate binding protein [Roseateles sp. SL47]